MGPRKHQSQSQRGDLRDSLPYRRRSRNDPDKRPETRDWHCIENKLEHHGDSNHPSFISIVVSRFRTTESSTTVGIGTVQDYRCA